MFKIVVCHLKSAGAAQSALNLAGGREGLESGEGRKKSTLMSDTKQESGKEKVGHSAAVVVCF